MYCDISIVRCSALAKERTISRLLRKKHTGLSSARPHGFKGQLISRIWPHTGAGFFSMEIATTSTAKYSERQALSTLKNVMAN